MMNAEIIKTLEDCCIKPTPMRMLVLEQLSVLQRPLSLAELESLLHPADRVTIYRTLQTFAKRGLVHSAESSANGAVYALCADGCRADGHRHDHPHFECEVCKQITCTDDFAYTVSRKNEASQYRLVSAEVLLKGLCPQCNTR